MGIFFRNKPQRAPQQGNSGKRFSNNKRYGGGNRFTSQETTIRSEKIAVEHKIFYFILKENQRGRFLRITEESNGKSDTIILPSTGLEDFKNMLESLLQTSLETAPIEMQQEDDREGDNTEYREENDSSSI